MSVQIFQKPDEQNKGITPSLVPRYGFGASPDWNMTSQTSYEDQVNKLINWGAKAVEITVVPKGQAGAQGKAGAAISNESMEVIKQLVNLNNLAFGIHAPYTSGKTTQIVDIIHDPTSVTGEAYNKLTKSTMNDLISVADKTGAQWINFHTTFQNWMDKEGVYDRPTVDTAKVYDVNAGNYQTVPRRKIEKPGGGVVWETDEQVAERIDKEHQHMVEGQISSDIYNFGVHHHVFVEEEIRNQLNKDEDYAGLRRNLDSIPDRLTLAKSQEEKEALLGFKHKLNKEINEKVEKIEEEVNRNPAFYPDNMIDEMTNKLSAYKPYLNNKTIDKVEKYMKDHYEEFTDGKGELLTPLEHLRADMRDSQKKKEEFWGAGYLLGKDEKSPRGVLTWKEAIVKIGTNNLVEMLENVESYEKEHKIDSRVKLFVENPDVRFLGDTLTTAEMVKAAQEQLRSEGKHELADRLGMNLDTSHANSLWGMEYVGEKGERKIYKGIMDGPRPEDKGQWTDLKDGKFLDTIKHMHLNDAPSGLHNISALGVPEELGGMGVKGADQILKDLKEKDNYNKMQVIMESGSLSGFGFKLSQEAIDTNNIAGSYYNAPVLRGGVLSFASPSAYADALFMGQNQQGQDQSYFSSSPSFKFF